MRRLCKILLITIGLCLSIGWCFNSALAAPVYLNGFSSNFTAYDYNTGAYWTPANGYVGCGPTSGAMILNYFQTQYAATGLLTSDSGLATANALHGSAYMDTGTNGFGSVYDIEPGLEGYSADQGYNIDVLFHVGPTFDPNAPPVWVADYGPYGTSWNNDANFYQTDGSTWWIDQTLFVNWATPFLQAGVPLFATVDSKGNLGTGDHWVPLVGVDGDTGMYYFYDTYDTALHSAAIAYAGVAGDPQWAINYVRTISFNGAIDDGNGDDNAPVPEPATILLLGSGMIGLASFGKKMKR